MQEQIFNEGNQQDFQFFQQNYSTSPQDIYFEQVVAALQDIIMENQFEQMQTYFMKKYSPCFQEIEENKLEYMNIFQQYQNIIEKYIQNALNQRVAGFQMQTFSESLQNRTHLIDQQILDMLQSFSDFQVFKRLILDYKSYYQEQEQLKLLTIKSTKLAQTKKVKSNKDNIFSMGGAIDLGAKPLTQIKKNQEIKKEKTQDELLIPQLVLTVRPLKKMVQE